MRQPQTAICAAGITAVKTTPSRAVKMTATC